MHFWHYYLNQISWFETPWISLTAANLRHHRVYSFYQPGQLAYGLIDGKGYVVTVDTGRTTSYTQAQHGYVFNDAVRARVAWAGKYFKYLILPTC